MANQGIGSRLIASPRWHPPVNGRRCTIHLATPAVDRCDRCGQPCCADCLRPVQRWRLCDACMTRIARERAGTPLPERLRTFWPALAATLVFGALFVGGVLMINRGASGAIPGGNLIGTTAQVACLQYYPDPGKLYVVGGLRLFGYPPAQLVLQNCHVQPHEAVRVQGSIWGYDLHGQRFSLPLGPVTAEGGANGVLVVTLTVPDPKRFQGSYEMRITATGHEGSSASAALSAEGNLAQPTAGPER
ncbi:MAG: hypothetical protein ACR2JY_05155 [Chloroflexota bacterium]